MAISWKKIVLNFWPHSGVKGAYKDVMFACMLSYISFPLIDMKHDHIRKKVDFNQEFRGQGQGHSEPKWNMTLQHLKMHPPTKCGIPFSIYIGDMLWTCLF